MAGDDFDQVIEQNHAALREFPRGNAEPLKALFSTRDDVSLANPFGPPVSGWEQCARTMERAATFYRDGESLGFDTVARHVGGDMAYIVEVERYRARVGGGAEMVPVALRVTTIFRREDGAWRISHRHADTITAPRTPESVIQR